MARPTTLEMCRRYLYTDIEEVPLLYRERIIRIRDAYTHWYCFPSKTRRHIADHIVSNHKVDIRTAYYDIEVIQILLGTIQEPSKIWMRYKVNAMLEDAYELAERQNDPKAMAAILDKMGKYNQLDKPDAEILPYNEIVPQPFEPTDDPTPLGLKRDPDIRKKKQKMLEKYASEIEVIDIPYEELKTDEKEEGLL